MKEAEGRYLGLDLGAETLKAVELVVTATGTKRGRSERIEHQKEPRPVLETLLKEWDWATVAGAAVTGRFSRLLNLPRVPVKQAQASGFRLLRGRDCAASIVSIGGHGFSVLELRPNDVQVFRENSRCSQGTGNFLRQLVARFDLTIEEASEMCSTVSDAAPLSGRCPVILKTDMTHLANKGECRARILAGLYDAVCENVQVLLKPQLSPSAAMLIGGVSQSQRIKENFRQFLDRHRIALLDAPPEDALFLEALGCAHFAQSEKLSAPPIDKLFAPPIQTHLERVPALQGYLQQVKRMPPPAAPRLNGAPRRVIIGFDIGSTGSKAVALDHATREILWEGYINTNGQPVAAAQALMQQYVDSPASHYPAIGFGATGSGREIVGSLLSTCYGAEPVFVLNEIAAHAEGALHFDPRVDTIFEIGGQDAKYIRLAEGRVVDAAMNEACSAGTGSFIEEQGRKFAGIDSVVQLGEHAAQADYGVSLGQHCSVFMAEIIDEAVAAGVQNRSIIAGIYDSIIQNYLNRVKGSRSVGDVIFCQGMPFSADALAAAVVRHTGSQVVIPPNPGTVGALGIGLLALRQLDLTRRTPLSPATFLSAQVERKDTFVCKSTKGCGGTGNCCRIDRLTTVVEEQRQRFTWGGGCSLWDRGTARRKLPDRAPDPFREREQLLQDLLAEGAQRGTHGERLIALTDEFQLKGLFPFFAAFFSELGFGIRLERAQDHKALKRGIERANVPYCAPMQQYHGLVTAMADRAKEHSAADILFLPMLRNLPRVGDETNAVLCPIVQASTDLMKWDLPEESRRALLAPVMPMGKGDLSSREFLSACRELAGGLGASPDRWLIAHKRGLEVQRAFDDRCVELGTRALEFCKSQGVTPIVVLGRTYTIYNTVLNSNVPAILREQGAIAIPVDCFPVPENTPVFQDIYWGYGQRNLRAAHHVRRSPGVYSLWCSNYSCGPDSFTLHFYNYLMEGKPYAIIETDGHSGDAGTKTRVEAFLHCVRQDEAALAAASSSAPLPQPDRAPIAPGGSGTPAQTDLPVAKAANDLKKIEEDKEGLNDIRRRHEHVLIPRMGVGAEALAACLRGIGVSAEALPLPDRETVRLGRRYTSGKECVPMCITLGSLLRRLEEERDPARLFSFFMPTACGPCRFGTYHMLHKITLERLGWQDRVRLWSPRDNDYFEGVPSGFAALVFTGFVTMDALLDALYDARPVERTPGAANEIYRRYAAEAVAVLEEAGGHDLSVPNALMQLVNGRLFGCADLLRRAGAEFAQVKQLEARPTVMVVGEIYVRCDPFANDFLVDKLEERGIRVRFAPFTEWLEYTDYMSRQQGRKSGFGAQLSSFVQRRIQSRGYALMADALGWPKRTRVQDSMAAAERYLSRELSGEAVLTVGGPLHEWREGLIDGVVSVGPLECMPNKIAEAQFFHVAEQEGLLALTLPVNGDPVDPDIIDNFAFEVQSRFRHRHAHHKGRPVPQVADAAQMGA